MDYAAACRDTHEYNEMQRRIAEREHREMIEAKYGEWQPVVPEPPKPAPVWPRAATECQELVRYLLDRWPTQPNAYNEPLGLVPIEVMYWLHLRDELRFYTLRPYTWPSFSPAPRDLAEQVERAAADVPDDIRAEILAILEKFDADL